MPKNHLYWILMTVLVSIFSAWCADPYAENFRYIMRKIKKEAINSPSERELFDAALAGALAAVDENSKFFPPKNYEELNQEFIQETGSLGILFYQTGVPSKTYVGATELRSAARLGGVLPGDEITAINGVSLKNASFEEVSAKLMAPVGTEVSLDLFRPSIQKELSVLLVAKRQMVSSVTGLFRKKDGSWSYHLPQISEKPDSQQKKILYVHIVTFGEKTVTEMRQILRQGVVEGVEGLVLDLRGNGGGLYEESIKICGMFLPEKNCQCVQVEGAKDKVTTSSENMIWNKPVVVLIDHNTASAAEILAVCLQDYGKAGVIKAICLGERSYGKGTIQSIFNLGPIPDDRYLENEKNSQTLWKRIWKSPDRGGFSFSTAEYRSPTGRVINRSRNAKETDEWGVFPNPGWNVNVEDSPRWKENRKKFLMDRIEFERLRKSGALPKKRWNEIYEYNFPLKRAMEVFDDVEKNFSQNTSGR